MVISVRTRRDVVVVDPDRFLSAARAACRELNPELTEAQAAAEVVDVYDAVQALLERDGQLVGEDLTSGVPGAGHRAPLPGVRVLDRADGLSAAGWLQEFVLNEQRPLQDYGCFLPEEVFASEPDEDAVESTRSPSS